MKNRDKRAHTLSYTHKYGSKQLMKLEKQCTNLKVKYDWLKKNLTVVEGERARGHSLSLGNPPATANNNIKALPHCSQAFRRLLLPPLILPLSITSVSQSQVSVFLFHFFMHLDRRPFCLFRGGFNFPKVSCFLSI